MRIGKHIRIYNAWLVALPLLAWALGYTLNAIVMGVNHGRMPVLISGCDQSVFSPQDFIHTCMIPTTHLKFLADWIVVDQSKIASLGDFLEWGSEFVWQFCAGAWLMGQCISRREE